MGVTHFFGPMPVSGDLVIIYVSQFAVTLGQFFVLFKLELFIFDYVVESFTHFTASMTNQKNDSFKTMTN